MKLNVSPFSVEPAVTFPLSFADIIKTEGVYADEDHTTSRLVVLRSGAGKLAVLFVSPESVQPANDVWETRKFTKTSEEFQVFIK